MAIRIGYLEKVLKGSEYSGFTWFDGGGEKGRRKYILSGIECIIEAITTTVPLPITESTEIPFLAIQTTIEKQQMEELLEKIAGDPSSDSIQYILGGNCGLTIAAKVSTVDEAMEAIENVQLNRKNLLSLSYEHQK